MPKKKTTSKWWAITVYDHRFQHDVQFQFDTKRTANRELKKLTASEDFGTPKLIEMGGTHV